MFTRTYTLSSFPTSFRFVAGQRMGAADIVVHEIVVGPDDYGAVRPFLAAQALVQLHQQGAAEGPGVGVLRVTPHLVGYLTQRAGGGRAEFAVEAERAVFFGQQTGDRKSTRLNSSH